MAEYKIHNRMTHWQKTYPAWISFAAIAFLLAVWEIICSTGLISSLFLPAPSAILTALGKLITSGEISRSLTASLYRILLGFALGSIIGLLVGLVTGTSALMDRIGTPIVNALYPIPKIALLPLFILWLGIGELSKVTIIALGVFFPVAMNTYSGVKNVDTLLIKVAVSFNASWWLTMKSVVLPSALPVIFAGLRLAAGTSLLLLVAAEMIAAQEGIGALILHYGDLMITDRLMAGVIVLSLLGLIFNLGLQWLEHKAVTWLIEDHTDDFFCDQVLRGLARDLRLTEQALNESITLQQHVDANRILQLYERLVRIFTAKGWSFERKLYASTSREGNKAMNLNSFIGLMGHSLKRVETSDGVILRDVRKDESPDFVMRDSEYVLTLDADSMLLRDYCLRLVYQMEQPGNERVAVIQTPYSSYRGAPTRIERIAAATTDIQHMLHQGMTTMMPRSGWVRTR